MQWKILKNGSPYYGSKCVVAHYVGPNKKPVAGVWEYCNAYWYTRNSERIPCSPYDRWCEVSDIIDSIEDRITDELKDLTMDMRRNRS